MTGNYKYRIDMQREILSIVNSRMVLKEELCGLTEKSVDRWISVNKIDRDAEVCQVLMSIHKSLFFIAVHSQDGIVKENDKNLSEVVKLREQLLCSLGRRETI